MNLILASSATTFLVVRALSRKSLTPTGVLFAVLTAIIHALHPWNLPFVLLISFYALATAATKVKHEVKAKLTMSSSGAPGGEGARNHIQVLANSIVASVLVLAHCYQLRVISSKDFAQREGVFFHGDILAIGIIAHVCRNYAAVLADTLSSELGILSKTRPVLITTLRKTPPGTNGGVTLFGVLAGGVGSAIIGLISVILLPYCPLPTNAFGFPLRKGQTRIYLGNNGNYYPTWGVKEKILFVAFATIVGVFGSLLDSLLGAVFQKSVIDIRTQKIVEGPNGTTVLVQPSSTHFPTHARIRSHLHQTPQSAAASIPTSAAAARNAVAAEKDDALGHERKPSRAVISGSKWGVLDNNQVNLAMAVLTSVGAMIAWRIAELAGCDSCSRCIDC
ncbi:integral membrane protein DUF92-domain-containing protein [Tuber brumale]|nr:integral membrane protein DUF92-domain-containing protein [Tuber brumale]